METNNIQSISHVIQLSVAPVFLLTAVATMINAMNTRLGRIVDRLRYLKSLPNLDMPLHDVEKELFLLARRIRITYFGMLFSVLSGLFVCLDIATAFVGALLVVDFTKSVAVVFIFAIISMIVALGMFLREISIAVVESESDIGP
ncbi:MAG: DUF2721 domain-containing protein [Candidatus Accumulibacter sp.]|jgi:hypothetical protein|nr:DUF2721 domain-containing protein [Accumulibacter sp.]